MNDRRAPGPVEGPVPHARLLFAVAGGAALALVARADEATLLLALEFLLLALWLPVRRGWIDPAAFRVHLDDGIAGSLSLPFDRVCEPRFAPGRAACLHDFVFEDPGGRGHILFPDLTLRERLSLAPRIAASGATFREVTATPAGPRAGDPRLARARSLLPLFVWHYAAAVALCASSYPRSVAEGLLLGSFALFYMFASFGRLARGTAALFRGAAVFVLLALLAAHVRLAPASIREAGDGGYFGTLERGERREAKRAGDGAAAVYRISAHPVRMRLLHNLLTHPDADVRWNIACSLRELRFDEALRRAFLTGVSDPDLHVRWVCAIRFVGEARDREVETFLGLLHDPLPEAREKAVRVLERYRGTKLETVRASLRDAWREETDPLLKSRIYEACGRVGVPRPR